MFKKKMNNDARSRNYLARPTHDTLAILIISCIYISLCAPYIIDDAYITFAYSRNFSELGSLVFRPGNNVAATSSFSWATLLGLLSHALWNPITWSKILGAACYIGTILGIAALLRIPRAPSQAQALASASVALPFGFALWSNYGMENGLLAILCFGVTLTLPRHQKRFTYLISPLLLLGICMTRPEGFGYAIAAWSAEFIRRWVLNKGKNEHLITLGIAAAMFGVFELYYNHHFGVFLPDSATSKIQAPLKEKIRNGWNYLVDPANLCVIWIVPASLIMQAFGIFCAKVDFNEKEFASTFIGGALTLAALAFALLSGGDWMPAARFLAFVLPFCAGSIAWGLQRHTPHSYRLMTLATYLILLSGTQIAATITHLAFIKKLQDGTDSAVIAMIDELNRIASTKDVIALSDIGYASYAFKGDVYDWWGLANRPIRERGESLGRIRSTTIREANPEFLVVYSNKASSPTSDSNFEGAESMSMGIVSDAELMSRYCLLKTYFFWEGRYHALMVRNDHAEKFKSQFAPIFPGSTDTCPSEKQNNLGMKIQSFMH